MNPTHATQPEHWRILNEGGANLVLRYAGSEPGWEAKSLRLVKRGPSQPKLNEGQLSQADKAALKDGWADQVIVLLLGRELTVEMDAFEVEPEWLTAWVQAWEKRRGRGVELDERTPRDNPPNINLLASTVWLVENVTHGADAWAVEIKVSRARSPRAPPALS